MPKILFVTLKPLDNHSRVLKEISTLIKSGFLVFSVSVNSGSDLPFSDRSVSHVPKRILGIPGISLLILWCKIICAAKKIHGFSIIHCNDLNTLPVGCFFKLFSYRKVQIVYDCQEYETETNGLRGIEKKIKKLLERLLIRFADEVITVSDSIANEYVRLYEIKKPHLVLNCPFYTEQPKRNFFREQFGIRHDQNIFLYQGALIKGRGIEMLLDVFSSLESDKNVLVCMGYGPLEPLIREKTNENDTIYFNPAVSPDELLNYTSSANYGVSFIEDSCLNHRYCLPNKIFEYLMAGLPVLTSNVHELKRLVEAEGVGVVAQANTIERFRKAVIASLGQDYSAIQQNVFEARKKYCWEEQEKTFLKVYRDL